MNWRTAKDGDKRTRTYFAWLPVYCDDGQTRWLEHVTVDEVYVWGSYDGAGSWSITSARPESLPDPDDLGVLFAEEDKRREREYRDEPEAR